MDDFRRSTNVHIGVGGWHCQCCGPTSGEFAKEKHRRWGRRRLKHEDRRRIEEEAQYPARESLKD